MRHTRLNHRSDKQDDTIAPALPVTRDTTPAGDAMSLQSSIGNAAVGQLMGARERASSESATPIDSFTQELIAGQLGNGEAMSAPLQAGMQGLAGGSAGDVRLHRDPQSDGLARMLGATAFTQGRDVFLRSDRDPETPQGRATLAHELTHVAQGNVGPGAVMREPDPDVAEPMDTGTKQKHFPGLVAKIVLDKGGTLDGGSQVPGHKGEVEFESLSFGGERGISSPGSGGGREREAPKLNEIITSRLTDQVSGALMRAAVDGDRIISARFTFVRQVEKGIVEEVHTIEFASGFITSYQTGSGDPPVETISFSFEPAPK